jgi:hypothetical protein
MKHYHVFSVLGASALIGLVGLVLAGTLFSPNNQPFGYIASAAASGNQLAVGLTLYAPWFEKSTYSGDLIAVPVQVPTNADGSINYSSPTVGTPDFLHPLWRARERLDAQNWNTGRVIVTTNGADVGTRFGWDQLTAAQRSALDTTTAADPTKVARTDSPLLNFVRGDRSREIASGGLYRNRTAVLGDLIHSPPRYVARPQGTHTHNGYQTFAAAQAARAPRVYVGANDGMLHAFDAATGNEVFAFVPSPVLKNLRYLAANPYLHQYFVDGPLVVEDAYFGGAWHTVLVGGLGAGGQGYFALDITSAEAIGTLTEDTAKTKVLWELTDTDTANLGFTYGRPAVVRLQSSGDFVVLLPNGYVNVANDGAIGDGKARLYALNPATGAILGQIAVSDATDDVTDPNGLSSVTAVDTDGDGRANLAYAGDIKGNVWRFDLSGAPGSWGSASAMRLFTATDGTGKVQAITTAPEVALHPEDSLHSGTDLLVYVATGRFFEASGAGADAAGHSVYGLWDQNGAAAVSATDLLGQTLTEKTHASGKRVRVASNNAVTWSTQRGWRVNLPAGERVLTDPLLRDGRLNLTSTNVSVQTGENWLLQLEGHTGGAPSATILDVTGDRALTTADNVDGNGDADLTDPEDRVVGQYERFGLASGPSVVIATPTSRTVFINHLSAISPTEPLPEVNTNPEDPGLIGGHIDLDVASAIYPPNRGTTDRHTHEWDDKTGLNTIDYLNILRCPTAIASCLDDPALYVNDANYKDLDEQVTDPTKRFVITVANAQLTPGAIIEINGVSMPVTAYAQLVRAYLANPAANPLPVYQLGPNPPAGVQRLTSFKLTFDYRAIVLGQIIGTNTAEVRGNVPGPNGEPRNGALTVDVLDATTGVIDPTHLQATAGLLWESTVFWHWAGPSYSESSWPSKWNNCFVAGDVCDCAELKTDDPICLGEVDLPPPDGGDDGTATACTVSYPNPNPRVWLLDFDEVLCTTTVVPAVQLRLVFAKSIPSTQQTTITFNYGGGLSQSVTVKPGDIFSQREGSPLQVDMTQYVFNKNEIQKVLLRNVGASALTVTSVSVSWTGGPADQKLANVRQEKPVAKDNKGGLPAVGPVTVDIVDIPIAATVASGCSYTLTLDYTTASGATGQASHTFDDQLTGIGGYPLEIDMDEASIVNDDDVTGVRVRSLLDEVVTVTKVTVNWSNATAGQKLMKIRDITGTAADVTAGGDNLPLVLTPKFTVRVGGVPTYTGDCPEDEDDDGTDGDGSGGGTDGGTDGDGSGTDGGDGGSGSGSSPDVSGFSITSVFSAGTGQVGRLLWRELIQQ